MKKSKIQIPCLAGRQANEIQNPNIQSLQTNIWDLKDLDLFCHLDLGFGISS